MKVDYDSVKEQFKFMIANDDDYIDTQRLNHFQMMTISTEELRKKIYLELTSKTNKNLKHLF